MDGGIPVTKNRINLLSGFLFFSSASYYVILLILFALISFLLTSFHVFLGLI